MKRILIIDESAAVRETIALILRTEFTVIQQPPEKSPFELRRIPESVDLVICGLAATAPSDAQRLSRLASQVPFAVLFLTDSRSALKDFKTSDNAAYLVKPFNPYELKEKVQQLVSLRERFGRVETRPSTEQQGAVRRFLEFPYVSRTAAILIQRFATTRLPILMTAELGCGADHVARGIHELSGHGGDWRLVDAARVDPDSLQQLTHELSSYRGETAVQGTVFIQNLDKLPSSHHIAFEAFLAEREKSGTAWRLITTSQLPLLEQVYRGEFPAAIYYRCATLTLTLPPLRERQEDIPTLADSFAQFYAKRLNLENVSFSPAALERLRNYLWFGNVSEIETVVAKTLTIRRTNRIEENDLVFDFGDLHLPEPAQEPGLVPTPVPPSESFVESEVQSARDDVAGQSGLNQRNGKSSELRVLIHELAHELKNPMVTIKTFAQLLGDRYDDEAFRARFHDIVDGDIERMDDLLEVMIEFADFGQPHSTRLLLEERLRSILQEIAAESSKRQANIHWKEDHNSSEILVDRAHLTYVLKNVLLAVLSQAKLGGDIEIEIEKKRTLLISYTREGARIMPITHYLAGASANLPPEVLPLRILLAKQLLERNGASLSIERSAEDRDILRMEFPVA